MSDRTAWIISINETVGQLMRRLATIKAHCQYRHFEPFITIHAEGPHHIRDHGYTPDDAKIIYDTKLILPPLKVEKPRPEPATLPEAILVLARVQARGQGWLLRFDEILKEIRR